MKESIYDLVVDELLARQKDIKAELKERFKRTRPFRQESVSPKEALVEYDEMAPEQIDRMREQFGDEPVDLYLGNIAQIQERYSGRYQK